MAGSKHATKAQQSAGALEVLRKVLISSSGDVRWEKKELVGLLLLIKAVASVGAGLACGILPIVGAPGFLCYVLSTCTVTFVFYHWVLQVDEEEFGGHLSLLSEDQNITIPLFLLTWVMTFSSVWF